MGTNTTYIFKKRKKLKNRKRERGNLRKRLLTIESKLIITIEAGEGGMGEI